MSNTTLIDTNTIKMPSFFEATPESFRQHGVSFEDREEINNIVDNLVILGRSGIDSFGDEYATMIERFADPILSCTNSANISDLESESKLNEVLALIRTNNPSTLDRKLLRLPIIGKQLFKFKNSLQGMKDGYDVTKDKIDSLISEIEDISKTLQSNVITLETVYNDSADEYVALGKQIVAGKIYLNKLIENHEDISNRINDIDDPLLMRRLNDLTNDITALDRNVTFMSALQLDAMETLPVVNMIRYTSQQLLANHRDLIKYVIPQWKKQFVLARATTSNMGAVEAQRAIKQAAKEITRRNAENMSTTALEAARAGQELPIDIEATQYRHDLLIKTLQGIGKIREEGIANRNKIQGQIQTMLEKNRITMLEHGRSLTK